MKFTLIHERLGRATEAETGAPGESIALAAFRARVRLFGTCEGQGMCLQCIRKVKSGKEHLRNLDGTAYADPYGNVREGEVQTCQATIAGEGVEIISGY